MDVEQRFSEEGQHGAPLEGNERFPDDALSANAELDADGEDADEEDESASEYAYFTAFEDDEVRPVWRIVRNVVLGVSLLLAAGFAIGPTAWFFLREPDGRPNPAVADAENPASLVMPDTSAEASGRLGSVPGETLVAAAPLPVGATAQPTPSAGALPEQALASGHNSDLATRAPASAPVRSGGPGVPAGTFDALFAGEGEGVPPSAIAAPSGASPVPPPIVAAVASTAARKAGSDVLTLAAAGPISPGIRPDAALPLAAASPTANPTALEASRQLGAAEARMVAGSYPDVAGLPLASEAAKPASWPAIIHAALRGMPSAAARPAPSVIAPEINGPVLGTREGATRARGVAHGSSALGASGSALARIAAVSSVRPVSLVPAAPALISSVRGRLAVSPPLTGTRPDETGAPLSSEAAGGISRAPASPLPTFPARPALSPRQGSAGSSSELQRAFLNLPAGAARVHSGRANNVPEPVLGPVRQDVSAGELPFPPVITSAAVANPVPPPAGAEAAKALVPGAARSVAVGPPAARLTSPDQSAETSSVPSRPAEHHPLPASSAEKAIAVASSPAERPPLNRASVFAASPFVELVAAALASGIAQPPRAQAAASTDRKASRPVLVRPAPVDLPRASGTALPVASTVRRAAALPGSLHAPVATAVRFATIDAEFRPDIPPLRSPLPAKAMNVATSEVAAGRGLSQGDFMRAAANTVASETPRPSPATIIGTAAALSSPEVLGSLEDPAALLDARPPRPRPADVAVAPAERAPSPSAPMGEAAGRRTAASERPRMPPPRAALTRRAPATKAVRRNAAARQSPATPERAATTEATRQPPAKPKRAAPASQTLKRNATTRPPRAAQKRTAAKSDRNAQGRAPARPAPAAPGLAPRVAQPSPPVRALAQPPSTPAQPPTVDAAPSLPMSLVPTRPPKSN